MFVVWYASQGDDAAPQSVRVELSSEADLFYHYAHSTDEASFQVCTSLGSLMTGRGHGRHGIPRLPLPRFPFILCVNLVLLASGSSRHGSGLIQDIGKRISQ